MDSDSYITAFTSSTEKETLTQGHKLLSNTYYPFYRKRRTEKGQEIGEVHMIDVIRRLASDKEMRLEVTV